ncbi:MULTISPECIES: response regulator [unclassified Clostridium]|uniref:response regulator n=1 Tax=unclassified Clostridium TaxID=2614128 RepID=UPI0025BA05F3|nr:MULTISPECIES: response regulator [unclassified Clostridium]
MRFFLIDDDISIINILKLIIEDRNLGKVIGYATNGIDGFEDIKELKPDVVIVDLLMPYKDGITIVKSCKESNLKINFIMLSQVTSKDMIAKAYENGIEFYIQKPVNAIEVENVIKKVIENINMNRTLGKIQDLFVAETSVNIKTPKKDNTYINKLKNILQKLGIMGELGSKDIILIIEYLQKHNETISDYTLRELCSKFTDNPKSMEQRIRRAATVGMINIANLGLEDYMNETFIEYSNGLYNFEQIKKEMDCIRGKTNIHGKINIKKFINGIIFYSER